MLTISDMTKRAQAEAVLRESQKMQAIGQLTGGIAHDFNNLLTVILGNLELARSQAGAADIRVAARIERSLWAAQRGGTLTSQLLAFARKQPLAPAPIDLAATLAGPGAAAAPHAGRAYRGPLRRHRRAVAGDGRPGAAGKRGAEPGAERARRDAGRRAADDRAGEQGAGRGLRRGAHAEVTPGDYVMLAVSDTGHGMTPDVVARVFEPFFTTKPDGQGTGLGLAMVFGFVKQSGGHVKIYSEPGEGTTVKLYLPRAIGVADPRQAAQRRAGRAAARIGDDPGGRGRGRRCGRSPSRSCATSATACWRRRTATKACGCSAPTPPRSTCC